MNVEKIVNIKKTDYRLNDFTRWHTNIEKNYSTTIGDTSLVFTIIPLFSGCGSVVLAKYYIYEDTSVVSIDINIFKQYVNDVLHQLKNDGVGSIITTLGEDFYTIKFKKSEKLSIIEDLFEMKELKEYHNYRHGPKYYQKLYIRTLEDV